MDTHEARVAEKITLSAVLPNEAPPVSRPGALTFSQRTTPYGISLLT
jgi:hypothetical protein